MAYEFARETRDHADALLWEVAAIIWGGQTLLLGFVLEAIGGKLQALILILFIATVGILMAIFNHQIMQTRSSVCLSMIEVMTNLENKLQMEIKPQQILSGKYSPGFQRRWSSRVNFSFVAVWVIVIVIALSTLLWRTRVCTGCS